MLDKKCSNTAFISNNLGVVYINYIRIKKLDARGSSFYRVFSEIAVFYCRKIRTFYINSGWGVKGLIIVKNTTFYQRIYRFLKNPDSYFHQAFIFYKFIIYNVSFVHKLKIKNPWGFISLISFKIIIRPFYLFMSRLKSGVHFENNLFF